MLPSLIDRSGVFSLHNQLREMGGESGADLRMHGMVSLSKGYVERLGIFQSQIRGGGEICLSQGALFGIELYQGHLQD
jgi:hypothetical protein